MVEVRLISVRLVVVFFVLLTFMAGYRAAGAQPPENNNREITQVIRESYGREREYTIEGVARADGSFHVRVVDVSSATVFESFFPSREVDGTHVRWIYREGSEVISRSALTRAGQLPTLLTMMAGAKDIVRLAVRRTESRQRVGVQDSWGCDVPEWLGGSYLNCSSVGNCCDSHDACYATFNCSANSWFSGYTDPLCLGCNAFIVACITNSLGSTGAASNCCTLGNCGQERCTLLWDDPSCTVDGGGSGGSGPGGPLNIDPDPIFVGGGGGWFSGPSGSITFTGGVCCFPQPPDAQGNPVAPIC